jgi:hypothetical protein
MFERILNRMRKKVRALQYVMTLHAEEEMNNDDLSIFDIEQAVLTGRIVERQKEAETGEWKYLVRGKSLEDRDVVLVSRLSSTGRLIIITVYVE